MLGGLSGCVGPEGDGYAPDTMLTADLSQPTFTWNSVKIPFQIRAQGLVPFGGKIYVLGGLAPDWASAKGGIAGSKRPNVGEFRKFVKAVGSRENRRVLVDIVD